MWKSIAVAGLIAGLNASAYATATVGEPAPEFAGTDTQGKQHRLSDYRGKTVVLEWTNHDCPYVRKHYGSGNMQAQQKAATDAGVVWLSIISSAQGKQGHVRPAQADALTESRNRICTLSMAMGHWFTKEASTASRPPIPTTLPTPSNM